MSFQRSALALLVASLIICVNAQGSCYTFYEGLCPGPTNCMCTLGESCGSTKNMTKATAADGSCSGSCRYVNYDACPGDSSCLQDAGSCGGSSSSGSAPEPPSSGSSASGSSTPARDQIISCAQSWCDQQIPYCQCNGAAECCGSCPYCGTFRCDCSGFVSYCWGLSYGYTTDTLPQVSHQISQEELLPGDAMLCQGTHVVFFGGWTDSSMQYYVAYQEPGCHTSGPHYAFKSVVPYPFNFNPSCFLPFRLNTLTSSDTCKSNLASKKDVIEAFFNPSSFPVENAKEAVESMQRVKEHKAVLGL